MTDEQHKTNGAFSPLSAPPETECSSTTQQEAKTELQAALTDSKRSPIKKYMELIIGDAGFGALLKYELIIWLCNATPGALGFVLRKMLYPKLFKRVGCGTIFGRNMTIRHPDKITIGDNCVFDDLVVLDAKGAENKGISIGNNVIVARNTVLSCKGGDIEIGDNSNISLNCMVHSEKTVTIGKNNLWAAYCYIIGGGNHDFDRTDIPIIQQGSRVTGITMEDDIWLGAGVTILDGCHIGTGVVIGAGSMVTKSIPDYRLAAGAPARIIRDRHKAKTQNDDSEKETQ